MEKGTRGLASTPHSHCAGCRTPWSPLDTSEQLVLAIVALSHQLTSQALDGMEQGEKFWEYMPLTLPNLDHVPLFLAPASAYYQRFYQTLVLLETFRSLETLGFLGHPSACTDTPQRA